MNIEAPVRKKHRYTQHLLAAPQIVFKLLCPVEEEKWVPDWNPVTVFSKSGYIEEHCIFLTENQGSSSIWVVTRYEPEALILEMFKVTPEHTVGRLEIHLKADRNNNTKADIMYEYTAIGPEGFDFLDEFTEEWYQDFMQRWEEVLNHFLAHGKKIEF